MNAGSLFTGIGGLDLAIPGDTVWMCEYDPHCQRVLAERFPGIPCYPDVRELDAGTPPVDVLCGGYPCQPFSVAGKRRGEADLRHLWPEMARVARLLRPGVLVLENVRGHLALGFDRVLADLAGMGYDARWGVVRASDVGAPHQRARLFVIAADPERGARRRGPRPSGPAPGQAEGGWAFGDARGRVDAVAGRGQDRERAPVEWGVYAAAVHRWEAVLGRAAPRPTDDRGRLMPEFVEWMMGFPAGWTDGVKRTQRLKMLGNAVVPQQAALALGLLW